jgi:hypothetical protein
MFLCPCTHAKTLLSYEQETEKVHCKCKMLCRVHFIITLLDVGNVLLCIIYQLNFTVFMYVTQISQNIYSVQYYPQFHVTAVGLGTYYLQIQGHYCILIQYSCL